MLFFLIGLSPRVEPTEDGDYRLCFDNSFSKLSEKMVFFEVIVEGQPGVAWGDEEWADMAEPESMVEYKLEDIRVRRTGGTPKRSATGTGVFLSLYFYTSPFLLFCLFILFVSPVSRFSSHSCCQCSIHSCVLSYPLPPYPLSLSLPLPVGDHGLSAQAPGAEPPASDHAEGLRGPGPLPTGGQPVEGLLLVLHEPPGHPDCGRHTGLHPPTPLRRQEGLQTLVSSGIFHHPHTLPSGIFHHPHIMPSDIFQQTHTRPNGIFHHPHTLPSGIFHHPHTLSGGIFHHPLPSDIFRKDAIEGCWD